MNILSFSKRFTPISIVALSAVSAFVWAAPGNQFTNIGSIANTRHNLTQSTALDQSIIPYMNNFRNNYGEVCIYCHTPHGSQTTVRMPLWNRTILATTFTTYDLLGTSTFNGPASQPGSNSRTCLSCHDGQTAIDSIVNMPGSGGGLASQLTTQNTAFLDSWTNPDGGPGAAQHQGFNSSNGVNGDGTGNGPGAGCLACHSTTGALPGGATGFAPSFSLFNIGTDLRNDHPVGMPFVYGTDWNVPAGTKGTSQYFELNGNGIMDKNEIRTYNGQVECASCHDPHGVPSAGPGSVFNRTFLRVENSAGSAVCLTCHIK